MNIQGPGRPSKKKRTSKPKKTSGVSVVASGGQLVDIPDEAFEEISSLFAKIAYDEGETNQDEDDSEFKEDMKEILEKAYENVSERQKKKKRGG